MNKRIAFIYTLLLGLFFGCNNENEEISSDQGIDFLRWRWVNSLTGPSDEDEIDAIASDAQGNVYLSGKFEEFLVVEGQPDTLISAGGADIMVVKYDRKGAWQWTKRFGGIGEDNIFDAACDSEGNIILSGLFQEEIRFGNDLLRAKGGFDFVVVKLSSDGEVLWTLQAGGAGNEGGNEVSIGPNNQVIVGAQGDGRFVGNNFDFQNTGGVDAYVLSITAEGTVDWVKAIRGSGNAQAKAIGVDRQGNVYLGGDFNGACYASSPSSLFELKGGRDAYMTNWTATGELRWEKSWGGRGDDQCKGVIVNEELDVYLSGFFEQTALLGADTLFSNGLRDLFLWKVDTEGKGVWLRQIASSFSLLGMELALDASGGLFFGLGLQGFNTFGSTSPLPVEVTAPGAGEWPVLIQYSKEGQWLDAIFADESENGRFGEISRSGQRVYLDLVYEGGLYRFGNYTVVSDPGNKEAAVVSIEVN
ncbi:MAG: hypothetical protein ACFB0B_00580 [Thermonemataceae bacterium]